MIVFPGQAIGTLAKPWTVFQHCSGRWADVARVAAFLKPILAPKGRHGRLPKRNAITRTPGQATASSSRRARDLYNCARVAV